MAIVLATHSPSRACIISPFTCFIVLQHMVISHFHCGDSGVLHLEGLVICLNLFIPPFWGLHQFYAIPPSVFNQVWKTVYGCLLPVFIIAESGRIPLGVYGNLREGVC